MLKATIVSILALAAGSLAACGGGKDEAATPAGVTNPAPTAALPSTVPAGHPAAQPGADVDVTGIAKASDGKTVAEIYAGKGALANQQVTFRGKVFKVNTGVMGMDWLHVRDGSGAEGSNDVTVTTVSQPTAKVGDTVLVTGTLVIDKDMGMGYKYGLMVEKADVKVEQDAATP